MRSLFFKQSLDPLIRLLPGRDPSFAPLHVDYLMFLAGLLNTTK